MKQNINKNQKLTHKTISNLLINNGNVFYLYSTYSTFSTVWVYNEDSIEIYRLAKGKVQNREIFVNSGINSLVILSNKKLNSDISKCGVVLDGDIFGFEIKKINLRNQITTDFECFKIQKYQSDFLNKVVEDVNNYKMWDVQYE